ncbi:DUF3352 domain-containing protein [Calothrix sp. NIES-3974]|uniref:DUF3352 domain-containing protein n=1 Tax=Calothrix sp. NIES-3974 TaxID=2005462 RepID=UPI000B6000A4|nr:DUF3352 domain-containing protein [Calothrix sp. NIES-3974]BAZ06385.1 hypothetical protein NIES3974_30460 [Calothrix sp. NIES-3974]
MTLPLASVSSEKKKKPSLLLTFSAVAVLITGGIAAVWFFTQGKPLVRSLPIGATVIPQDAVFTVSLTTDVQQWDSLREFGTKQLQTELDRNLIALRDRFLSRYGFDFQQHVQPWVGDGVTFAVLAPPKPAEGSSPSINDTAINPQPLLVVLPIKNPQAGEKILTQMQTVSAKTWRDTPAESLRDRTYGNVKIKEATNKNGEELAIAIVDGGKYVVMSDESQAINQVIDAQQQQTTINKLPGFADNFTKIASYQPFAQFYLNIPSSAQLISGLPNRQLPAQVLGQLQNHQGLVGTVLVEPEGVRLKAASWLKPNSRRTLAVENNAATMAKRVPAQTMMLWSGSNLRRLWTDYVATSQGNSLAPINPEQLRKDFKSLTNLELERDFLSWMGGEFALSIVPASSNNDFRAALLFMVQVRDRPKADAAMKKLDEAMSTQYQLKIEKTTVANQELTRWFSPFGTLTASHGWMDNNVKFITMGAPITDIILPATPNPLAQTSLYQTAVPSPFNPGNSNFFLDVERLAKNFPLPPLFPNQQSLLAATSTIGISTNINDNRSIQYEALIRLRKTDKPSPLPTPMETLKLE